MVPGCRTNNLFPSKYLTTRSEKKRGRNPKKKKNDCERRVEGTQIEAATGETGWKPITSEILENSSASTSLRRHLGEANPTCSGSSVNVCTVGMRGKKGGWVCSSDLLTAPSAPPPTPRPPRSASKKLLLLDKHLPGAGPDSVAKLLFHQI